MGEGCSIVWGVSLSLAGVTLPLTVAVPRGQELPGRQADDGTPGGCIGRSNPGQGEDQGMIKRGICLGIFDHRKRLGLHTPGLGFSFGFPGSSHHFPPSNGAGCAGNEQERLCLSHEQRPGWGPYMQCDPEAGVKPIYGAPLRGAGRAGTSALRRPHALFLFTPALTSS